MAADAFGLAGYVPSVCVGDVFVGHGAFVGLCSATCVRVVVAACGPLLFGLLAADCPVFDFGDALFDLFGAGAGHFGSAAGAA